MLFYGVKYKLDFQNIAFLVCCLCPRVDSQGREAYSVKTNFAADVLKPKFPTEMQIVFHVKPR